MSWILTSASADQTFERGKKETAEADRRRMVVGMKGGGMLCCDTVHGGIGLGCIKIVSSLCYTRAFLSMFTPNVFYYVPTISA